MKKKFLTIFAMICIIFSSLFIGACGKKYDKLEFELFYSLTGENWQTFDDELLLNYGDNGELKFEDDLAVVYFKVEVKNVKSKYLGNLTISPSSQPGVEFSNLDVESGEMFEAKFSISSVKRIETKIDVLDNNSGKSCSFKTKIYPSLSEIKVNDKLTPAMTINSWIDLEQIDNIEYISRIGDQELINQTNQRKLDYSISGLGHFEVQNGENVFTTSSNWESNLGRFSKLDGSELKFFGVSSSNGIEYYPLSSENSVVEITVKSEVNENLGGKFYIYLAEAKSTSYINLVLAKNEIETGSEYDLTEIKLFENGNFKDKTGQDFSSCQVAFVTNVDSIYREKQILTKAGKAGYLLGVKVDGDSYNFSKSGENRNGIVLESGTIEIGDEGSTISYPTVKIGLAEKSTAGSENKLDFVYEIAGLDFSLCQTTEGSEAPVYDKKLNIEREKLPVEIIVNDEVVSKDSGKLKIYSTNDSSKGLKLHVDLEPNNGTSEEYLYIQSNTYFELSNGLNVLTADYDFEDGTGKYYKIKRNSDVYVKFSSLAISGRITESVLNFRIVQSPDSFIAYENVDPTYKDVGLRFENVVTLSEAPELYSLKDKNGKIINDKIYLASSSSTYVYAKLSANGALDKSTVKFVIESNDDSIKFENGLNYILLDNGYVRTDGNGVYMFKLRAETKLGSGASLKVVVADGSVGLDKEIAVEVISTTTDLNMENAKINAISGNVKSFSDIENGAFNFAIQEGTLGLFEIVDGKGNSSAITEFDYWNNEIEGTADCLKIEKMGNKFSIVGNISDKTTATGIYTITFRYYSITGEEIKRNEKSISVQIAVYKPVKSIIVSKSRDYVSFINNLLQNGLIDVPSQAEISYQMLATGGKTPAEKIYFWDKDNNKIGDGKNLFTMTVEMSTDISDSKIDHKMGTKDLFKTTKLESLSSFGGSFVLNVTGEITGNITYTFKVGDLINSDLATASVNIEIKQIQKAVGFDADFGGNERVLENGDVELNLSHLALEENAWDEKKFKLFAHFANIGTGMKYNNLGARLFKYELDSDGRIVVTNGKEAKYQTTLKTENLYVEFENNKDFLIKTKKGSEGGYYLLEVYTIDSWNGSEFENIFQIHIRVSDGVKQAYVLYSESDLKAIGNSNSSNFVLGANISTGEGFGIISAFNGSLKSDTITNQKYSITLNFDKYSSTTDESNQRYIGLFAQLGEKAVVENIIFKANLADIEKESNNDLYYGVVAGINNGTIKNVEVEILSANRGSELSITGSDNGTTKYYFGGIVGSNTGAIETSTVKTAKSIAIKFGDSALMFGGFAGLNTGKIVGQYSREKLTELKLDALVGFELTVGKDGSFVGGIAGESTGEISGVAVGGKILVAGALNTENNEISLGTSLFGGIAGSLVGSAENESKITDSAGLGLDLTSSNSDLKIGGIVGNATNFQIEFAKFVSVELASDLGVSYGSVSGKASVAGIVANATDGTVEYSSVESFVQTINNIAFYNLGSLTGDVAGIGFGTFDVESSFVKANLTGQNAYTIANTTSTDCYFVGRVDVSGTVGANNVFDVVVNDLTVDFDNETINGQSITEFETAINDKVKDNDNFKKDNDYNILKIKDSVSGKTITISLPYLIKDNRPIMILAPESISASPNQNYLIKINSEYQEVSQFGEYEVAEISFVNFIVSDQLISAKDFNTHRLINTSKDEDQPNGLVDMSVLSNGTDAGLTYQIVGSGYNYAMLGYVADGDGGYYTIRFIATSGNTPIVVKVSSVFNKEAVVYLVFYSQLGVSKLTVESDYLKELPEESYLEGCDTTYQIDLYKGANGRLVSVGAENTFKQGKDVKFAKTIFDDNSIFNDLKIGCEYVDEKITISKLGGIKDWQLSLKDVDFNNKDQVEVIFTLSRKFDESRSVEIGKVGLIVRLFKSAEDLTITDSDNHYEISTEETLLLEAELKTSYLDDKEKVKDTKTYSQNDINISGDVLTINENSSDSVRIRLLLVDELNQVDKQLRDEILLKTGKNGLADLFDFVVTRTRKETGYAYHVQMSAKEEYVVRKLDKRLNFEVVMTAVSIDTVSASTTFTLKPTHATTVRVENYAVKRLDVASNIQNIVSPDTIETSIITPGGIGSVMMIYVEPTFANVKSISLTSSVLSLPSGNAYLHFTQYVYNTTNKRFETLVGGPRQIGETINLQAVSTSDFSTGERKLSYNGVIYVRVALDKFSGVQQTITADLTVVTTDGINDVTRTYTKPLSTEYLPGASLSFEGVQATGENINSGYIVETGSTENRATIKLVGYQFNSSPRLEFGWNVLEKSNYFYTNKTEIFDKDEIQSIIKSNGYVWAKCTDATKGEFNKFVHLTEYKETGYSYYKIISYSKIENINNNITYLIGDYIYYQLENQASYNSQDQSYSLDVLFNVSHNIPCSFMFNASLQLVSRTGEILTDSSDYLYFYPADYMIEKVEIKNLANGNNLYVPINMLGEIELMFTTTVSSKDASSVLFARLVEKYCKVNEEEYDYSKLLNLFSYNNNGQIEFDKAELLKNDGLDVEYKNGRIFVSGSKVFSKLVSFGASYYYKIDKDGLYSLEFGNSMINNLQTEFNLKIDIIGTEDNARPIYSANQMFDADGNSLLVEGGHYILMNDIELENILPIEQIIGSFDGNNHKITIKSFRVGAGSQYGLFASIGTYTELDGTVEKETILKNITVNYNQDLTIGLSRQQLSNIVFGGLVATNNGGLIYNCEVINSSSAKSTITILPPVGAEVVAGLLVGENSGNITNSRVGTGIFKNIEKGTEVSNGELLFVVGNTSANSDNQANFGAKVGGFAGENSGIIASSYVANTSVTNYSNLKNGTNGNNQTAGFVASNSGKVSYSYVQSTDKQIYAQPLRQIGNLITSEGNGCVAGFVFDNSTSGSIDNCYANLLLKTDSAFIAGFVYNNSGEIQTSYSATAMNANNTNETNAEQPFVGADENNQVLSTGTLKNCFYLDLNDVSVIKKDGQSQAIGLSSTNIKNTNSLTGFVFVESNSREERQLGVWSFFSSDNIEQKLPQLTSANIIAYSSKVLKEETLTETGTEYKYTNTTNSYRLGSANNPYIIRDKDEYNSLLAPTVREDSNMAESGFVGYARFIDDVDFEDTNIYTTNANYQLGSTSSITSLEGNGMTISNISLNVSENTNQQEIGLFSKVENAYIKNLNLKFKTPTADLSGRYNTSGVKYSGGLAGRANNSKIINITLEGSATIAGSVMVGGAVGEITGDSMLNNITSNLRAQAVGDESVEKSYAGGIVGYADFKALAKVKFNMLHLTVNGQSPFSSENSISAKYAGGIVGYANENTKALKLKYNVASSDTIFGSVAAGGLVGELHGQITASQVTAKENTQYEYDTTLGKYVIRLGSGKATLDTEEIGNTGLVSAGQFAGGLVGISVEGAISASYSKASISKGEYVGGISGISYGSSLTYSYAVPCINLDNSMKYVGGLFGKSASKKEIGQVANTTNNTNDLANDVQFSFSTLLLDDSSDKEDVVLDYICAQATNGLQTGNSSVLIYVYAGIVEYQNFNVKNSYEKNSKKINLKEIYDIENNPSVQKTTFDEVFSTWSVIHYWSLDNSKYFPLLLDDSLEDFIVIDSADDFLNINYNPDGRYKITQNIEIPVQNRNWIIYEEFTGQIVGEIEGTDQKPVVTLKGLIDQTNDTTGLFKQTTNAKLSNIEFRWVEQNSETGAINLNGKSITTVAGLSCIDNGSLFSAVDVVVQKNGSNGHLVYNESIAIQGFGGLVGDATNSNITACKFNGSLNAKFESEEHIYVGGLVGNAMYKEGPDGELNSMIIMNSYLGSDGEDANLGSVKFKFSVASNSSITKNFNFGFVAGYADKASISTTNVGGFGYTGGFNVVSAEITLENKINSFIGGVIGESADTAIKSITANTNIKLVNNHKDNSAQLAGVVAKYSIGNEDSNATINMITSKAELTTSSSFNNITIGGGIASSSGDVHANNILLLGSVKQTGNSNQSETGGFVARVESGEFTAQTISSNVDITTTATTVYAGGLVGNVAKGTTTLTNATSSGTIAPVSSGSGEKLAYVGGLVGRINSYATFAFTNGFSTSSVLTGQTDKSALKFVSKTEGETEGKAVKKTVNALLGESDGKATFENVFYSSDISLCQETNEIGTNLSSNTLWAGSQFWANLFDAFDWKATSNNGLPYLGNLESAYFTTGLLTTVQNTTSYLSGSSLNPELLSERKVMNEEASFTFYRLTIQNLTEIMTSVTDNNTVFGTLKGIVVADDVDIVVEKAKNPEDALTVRTLFTSVGSDSAISNLHIKLEDDGLFNVFGSSETTNTASSIIAENNEGIIFNSSVQGHGLKLNTVKNGQIGLVAGTNKGVIDSCFSSVEIVETKNNSVSGLVYFNTSSDSTTTLAGLISNCYFTGYIGNELENKTGVNAGANNSVSSSAIVYENSNQGFVYNSYSAGVVQNINDGGTSFVATISAFNGENNFVDEWSNSESFENISGLTLKDTTKLLTTDGLAGKWYNLKDNADLFGYNFGYPIIKFNKQSYSAGNTSSSMDFEHQNYTGDGGFVVKADSDNKTITGNDVENNIDVMPKFEERYLAIINGVKDGTDTTDYDRAFKIPHLGIVKAINDIYSWNKNLPTHTVTKSDGSKEVEKISGNMNFVVIYDLDGKEQEWDAVDGFTGLLMSDKYYKQSLAQDEKEDTYTKTLTVISNLKKNGLFSNIKSAYFRDLSFANMVNFENSGVLGTTVVGHTTVKDIKIQGKTAEERITIKGTAGGVGALFGEIQNGTVNVFDFDSSRKLNQDETDNNRTYNLVFVGEGVTFGLVSGKISGGTLNIQGANTQLYVLFKKCAYAGGIVGEMNGGEINGLRNNVQNQQTTGADAGAEGEENEFNTNNTITVNIAQPESETTLQENGNPALIVEADKNTDKDELKSIKNGDYDAGTLGGVIGKIYAKNSSDGKVENTVAKIKDINVNFYQIDQNQSSIIIRANSFGGLVGEIAGAETETANCFITATSVQKDADGLSLTIRSKFQEIDKRIGLLAGVVEKFGEGSTSLTGSISATNYGIFNIKNLVADWCTDNENTTVNADETAENESVGTFVGYVNGNVSVLLTTKSVNTKSNILTQTTKDNKLLIKAKGVTNLGGIAGYYEFGEFAIAGMGKVSLSGSVNVGGVFGYVKGSITSDTFKEILLSDDKNNTQESKSYFKEKNSCADILFEGFSEDDYKITKYKNIGGLFGVLASKNDNSINEIINSNQIKFTATETGSLDSAVKVENVGGVAGKFAGSAGAKFKNTANITYEYPEIKDVVINKKNPAVSDDVINSAVTTGSGEDEKIVQQYVRPINVGGVFGFVEINTITGRETTNKITINGLSNTGEVQGYQNVGGIIGAIDASNAKSKGEGGFVDIIITGSDEEFVINNSNGFFNYYQSENDTTPVEPKQTTCKVSGVMNVGGIVGYAKGVSYEDENYIDKEKINLEIKNFVINGNINGNVNVGGLVGYADKVDFESNAIGEYVTIKGILYNFAYMEKQANENDAEKFVLTDSTYIPTNIGGMGGRIENSKLNNNLMKGKITTTEEGRFITISTTQNFVAVDATTKDKPLELINLGDQKIIKDKESGKLSYGDQNNMQTQLFGNMVSGVGGLAGSIDFASLKNSQVEKESKINNYISAGKDFINAQMGINVGALYGSYIASDNEGDHFEVDLNDGSDVKTRYLIYPYVYGTNKLNLTTDSNSTATENCLTVDGAYNIGGLVGLFKTTKNIADISNTQLSGNANIVLQNKISGFYVGGLVGYLDARGAESVTDLQIVQKSSENTTNVGVGITIDSSTSYYMGGLVGRLAINKNFNAKSNDQGDYVSSGNFGVVGDGEEKVGSDVIVTTMKYGRVTTADYYGERQAQEFGGLVGLLKVDNNNNTNGLDIFVQGQHNYPFTINTIENGNYYDGDSTFKVVQNKDQNTNDLVAQATYVNCDRFNISASFNSQHWTGKNGVENITNKTYTGATNPTRQSDTRGWAKEYTMFKAMQRYIPDETGSNPAISNIFDASNITQVGTIANMGLSGQELITDQGENGFIENGFIKKRLDEAYICYTIYAEYEGNPTLYSAIGQARIMTNEQGEIVTEEPYTRYGTELEYLRKFFGDKFNLTETEYIDFSSDSNQDYNGLTYVNFGTDRKYKTTTTLVIDDFTKETIMRKDNISTGGVIWDKDNSQYRTSSIIYKVPNYLEKYDMYFEFTLLYTNSTVDGSTNINMDGNVFNVVGVRTENSINAWAGKNSLEEAKKWLTLAGAALLGVLAIPLGAAGAWALAVRFAIKGVSLAFVTIGGAGLGTMFGRWNMGRVLSNVSSAQAVNLSAYYMTTGETFGSLSYGSKTLLYYEDGMLRLTGDQIFIGPNAYTTLSTDRPKDYYKKMYVLNDSITGEEKQTLETISQESYNKLGEDDKKLYSQLYYYRNGIYYYLTMAIPDEKRDYTSMLDVSKCTEIQDYIYENGIYYIRGTYNNNIYQYASEITTINGETTIYNNIEKDGGVYKLFGRALTEGFVEKSVTLNYTYSSDYSLSSSDSSIVEDTNYRIIKKYLGYDAMKGIYFTYNGTRIKNGTIYKIGIFERTDNPSGKYGIDYISKSVRFTKDDENGNQIIDYMPMHFQFAGVGDYTETADSDITSSTPAIYQKIYPSSFENHYENKELGGVTKDDSLIFIQSEFGIPHNVTYYHYIGGYRVKKIDEVDYPYELVNTGDLSKVENENDWYIPLYYIESVDNKEITTYFAKYSDIVRNLNNPVNITLYTYTSNKYEAISNDEKDKVSVKYLYADLDGAKYALTTEKAKGINDEYSKFYKLSNYFMVYNNELYHLKDLYFYRVEQDSGTLKFILSGKLEDQNVYRGRVCMNSEIGFYTKYKYMFEGSLATEKFLDKKDWNDKDVPGIYAYVKGKTEPNYGPTYFVEGCRLILNGYDGQKIKVKQGKNSQEIEMKGRINLI